MYNKSKSQSAPSDNQAREKLILYIYEYLMHNGAPKAGQTFLAEINWNKSINLNEPPGFLSSWWSVFWDIYCAAPERRETHEHSAEAKSFHDYGLVNSHHPMNGIGHPNAASPLGQMPPNDGLGGPGMPPGGFFPHHNSHLRPSPPQQPSQPQPPPHQQPPPPPPHGQMAQNQFISRYPGGPRPGVRMPPQHDFNGPPVGGGGSGPGTPMMSNQGDGSDGYGVPGSWPNAPPPGMLNHRMNPPPRGQMGPGPGPGPGQMNYGGMRGPVPPNQSMGPGVHGMPGMVPGPGPGPGGRPWQPNQNINYSSPSPANSYGGPGPGPGGQGPGGPQGDGMYPVMKPGGNMPGFPMGPGGGPEGPMGQLGPDLGPPMSSGGNGLDGMKNSPANGPGTPREDSVGVPMSDYGYGQENDQNESEAILKIKESMQEEAKKFEKDTPNDHAENFMPY